MTDKTAYGAFLAYVKESSFRCGNGGTFATPILDTTDAISVMSFDVIKAPPDPPISYRTREEYWEIGEGRSLARITDLGYTQGEVSLELALQTAIFLYYALGTAVTAAAGDYYYHDISEHATTLPSMAMLYQQSVDPTAPSTDNNNDICMGIYGVVVSSVTINIEQGAEITMTVDLMSARSENLSYSPNNTSYPLSVAERPARFTLKVFTYEDFVHEGSFIKYADAPITVIGTGTLSAITATSMTLTGWSPTEFSETTSNAIKGYLVRVASGQGMGQIRYIDYSETDEAIFGVWTATNEEPWIVTPTTTGATSVIQVLDTGFLWTTAGVTSFPYTPSAVLNDLVGTDDWTHVDTMSITITNTLELKPCVGSPYPAKFVVGKREYSLRTHIYPQYHKTLLDLRNTQVADYTGPIYAKIKLVDANAGVDHALEFTHTSMYLSDFPDHIPDWDEVIVGIDMEYRNAVDDEFFINSKDTLSASQYAVSA